MKKLAIYEPAMCCSTGVCGVEVDPVLVQFAADLQWLAEQGVAVARYNLSQQPQAFAENPDIVREMEAGMERLPIVTLDGRVISTGVYLSRAQLTEKLGLAIPPVSIPAAVETACCKPGGGCC
ncbi:MAG: arsenite efflux transporter metallochaperone ArsD [Methylococcaceae bacterium]|nr:arsenite efflux transporter metallochaperone ArsD [Methylococcaceae bacterium]